MPSNANHGTMPSNNGFMPSNIGFMPSNNSFMPSHATNNGGYTPVTFTSNANGHMAPNASANNHANPPWGNPDVKTFTSCLNTVDVLSGLNWLQFKFKLTNLAEANGLAQFLHGPPQGHPYPTISFLEQEYHRYSTAIFNGVYS